MANTDTIDGLMTTYFSRNMLAHLEARGDTIVFDWLDKTSNEARAEEEPMPHNMQPKDILVHLEKGDRTEEFVEPNRQEANLQDPAFNHRFVEDPLNMAVQQMDAQIRGIGMSSSQRISGLSGGLQW